MKNGTAPDNGCSPKFLPLDLFAEKHRGGLSEQQVLIGGLSDLIGSEKGDRADNIARRDDGCGGERKAVHTLDGAEESAVLSGKSLTAFEQIFERG